MTWTMQSAPPLDWKPDFPWNPISTFPAGFGAPLGGSFMSPPTLIKAVRIGSDQEYRVLNDFDFIKLFEFNFGCMMSAVLGIMETYGLDEAETWGGLYVYKQSFFEVIQDMVDDSKWLNWGIYAADFGAINVIKNKPGIVNDGYYTGNDFIWRDGIPAATAISLGMAGVRHPHIVKNVLKSVFKLPGSIYSKVKTMNRNRTMMSLATENLTFAKASKDAIENRLLVAESAVALLTLIVESPHLASSTNFQGILNLVTKGQ